MVHREGTLCCMFTYNMYGQASFRFRFSSAHVQTRKTSSLLPYEFTRLYSVHNWKNNSTGNCFSMHKKARLHFLLDECKGDHPDEAEDPAAGQGRRAGGQARRVVGAVHGVPAGVVGVQHRRAGSPAHAPCPPRAVTTGHGARHPWGVTGGRGACRSRTVTGAETAQNSDLRTQNMSLAHCTLHPWHAWHDCEFVMMAERN
jgi:hypothetical protein